ncbi:MAG: hypothetical protein KDA41_16105, partial [Planctomycetales bacterium]|nr:hypothetical protein [Planctomycetales bacterium]
MLLSLILTIAAAACVAGDERLLEDKDLSGQQEVVNAANAWHVTDNGLKKLRSYLLRGEVDIYMRNKVRKLTLDGTRVTDAGLRILAGDDGLFGLEELSLANTQVGDAGLESLAQLKNLRLLKLGRTLEFEGGVSGPHVTDAGVSRLQAALPACRIEHERKAIDLPSEQAESFKLWSKIAEPRLD